MMRKAISVAVASLVMVGVSAAYAQDKTRAEVKSETRAAGVTGDATAEKPTPTGKVVGGRSRAEIKAARDKSGGAASAEAPTPGGKIVGGKSRAEIKAARDSSGGAATADAPTPGPVRK